MNRNAVLVTGGAGFIGSELVRQLHARGDRVIVVDNLVNGRRENIEDVLGDRVTMQTVDIRDIAALRAFLPRVRTVFHLACLGVRHSIHSPLENHDVNATATLRLLEVCRAADVPRFVCVSSSEVYGTARSVPMTEDHPTYPCTVYGASKLAGECYARAFHRTYGYPTVVVRPFNTYGPRSHHEGDSGEVIPKFLLRALAGRPLIVFGDGSQTRDFTFVSDTAAGILAAGEHEQAAGETINLGSGRELTINELAETIGRAAGRRVTLQHDQARPGDVLRLCADTTRAAALLNFTPRVALEDGVRRLMAWYEQCGADPQTLLEQEVVRNWTVPQPQ